MGPVTTSRAMTFSTPFIQPNGSITRVKIPPETGDAFGAGK